MSTVLLEQAYRSCEQLVRSHYENFPVASWLLPKHLRRPIAVIYAFARSADDIADEGDCTVEERLAALKQFERALQNIANDLPVTEPMFLTLKQVIQVYHLPTSLFFDLLSAFKQDVTQKTYETTSQVLEYCRRSANPIGRLLLHLTQNVSDANLKASDDICTALQLINFLQDIHSDSLVRNRCYLPLDELHIFNIQLADIHQGGKNAELNRLIQKKLMLIEEKLRRGALLLNTVHGFFGFELCVIIASATKVMKMLRARNNSYTRPTLKAWHAPSIFIRAAYWYIRSAYFRML